MKRSSRAHSCPIRDLASAGELNYLFCKLKLPERLNASVAHVNENLAANLRHTLAGCIAYNNADIRLLYETSM